MMGSVASVGTSDIQSLLQKPGEEGVSDKFKLQFDLNDSSAEKTFEDIPHDKASSYNSKNKYLQGNASEMTGTFTPGSPKQHTFAIGYAEALIWRSLGNQENEDAYENSLQSKESSGLKEASFVEDGDKMIERKLTRFKQFLYQQALQGLTNE